MAPPPRETIEFKTLSGVTLRGWLYPAEKRGPGIILSAGFNMPKDVVVPDIAEWYQQRGFTALIFDTYGIGASDGEPRHDSDMQRRVDDFIDSVTWLSQNPLVDPEKIAVWGLCFDGNIMLATAASDRRIAAVVAVAPMIDVTGDPERREAILELGLADRAGQLAGEEPVYLPLVDEDGVTPLGQFLGNFFTTMDNMKMPIENRVTAHTYMRCLNWNILHLLPKISPTPVIMVTPELDQVFPAERQKEAFDMLGEPKEHCVIVKKNHFDWMFGDMDNVFNKQLNFLKKHMQL
ncbi:peptidase S15 [Lepidopterella palustris CBS 459.81]|uniref:Peptidase S15 n=1 Tax=Lepidopterella palustris CBS 459.81 TaxID=1314670 RepID=A0A8E2E103_9PEZI|nr:peptidase S15 [Lepidopterella palustris CBS 459.81]